MYLYNEKIRPDVRNELNPSADGCGLLWYPPLVPVKKEKVHQFVEFVNYTTSKYGLPSLITLSLINYKCMDSTIPIIFNFDDSVAVRNAHLCLDELIAEGQKKVSLSIV